MPTSRKVKKILLKSLPPLIEGTIVELGAGFGSLAFPLAKRYPNVQVMAYEISPVPYLVLVFLKWLFRYRNLKVQRKNFYHASFEGVGLAVCYLYPRAMKKLKGKFERELPQGALIVSNTFSIPGWPLFQEREVEDLYRTKIFFYQKT